MRLIDSADLHEQYPLNGVTEIEYYLLRGIEQHPALDKKDRRKKKYI